MATGLKNRFAAAADLEFQKMVAEAVHEAAVNIYSEGTGVTSHTARALYATAVLNDPPTSMVWNGQPIQPHPRTFAFACAIVGQGVDASSTEAAISNAVAAVWNALAGA